MPLTLEASRTIVWLQVCHGLSGGAWGRLWAFVPYVWYSRTFYGRPLFTMIDHERDDRPRAGPIDYEAMYSRPLLFCSNVLFVLFNLQRLLLSEKYTYDVLMAIFWVWKIVRKICFKLEYLTLSSISFRGHRPNMDIINFSWVSIYSSIVESQFGKN